MSEFWSRRHDPERKETMIGVQVAHTQCRVCGGYKPRMGCKMVDIGSRRRVFVCGDCVSKGAHLCIK